MPRSAERTILISMLAFWGLAAGAQTVQNCPTGGAFVCVPWDDPPVRPECPETPAPPIPLFAVEPKFIEPETFHGFIGRGTEQNLEIYEGALPDGVRELLEDPCIPMDPDKLYVLPSDVSGINFEGDYLLFNGVNIE